MDIILAYIFIGLLLIFLLIPAIGYVIGRDYYSNYSPTYFECMHEGAINVAAAFGVMGVFSALIWSIDVLSR